MENQDLLVERVQKEKRATLAFQVSTCRGLKERKETLATQDSRDRKENQVYQARQAEMG